MKLTKSLLIVTIACGTVWAQAPATSTAKAPAKTRVSAAAHKPAATKPAAPTVASAAKPAVKAAPIAHHSAPAKPKVAQQKSPMAKPPLKAPVKVVHAKPMPVATKKAPHSEGEVKPASVKEASTTTFGKMRDPFVSPVVRSSGSTGPACSTGKRCLVVDQIVLKGIVKSPSGFIAVVENPAKRAYFMRENDPVFNGKITKITGDTVVFQEQVMDKLGKQTMREVVKKVNAPIV